VFFAGLLIQPDETARVADKTMDDQSGNRPDLFHKEALRACLKQIVAFLRYHASLLERDESDVETVAMLLSGAQRIENAAEQIKRREEIDAQKTGRRGQSA
jgi:hypothetical protein